MRRIAIAAVTAAAVAGLAGPAQGAVQVSTSGWAWGNPTPQGNTIRALDFAGATGYAVGDDGTALRTVDGGATWTGLATGTSADLSRVQSIDANTVVVLGGDGCVLRRSVDGGATFRRIYTSADVRCSDRVAATRFVDASTGYVFLRDGSVLRTSDGGQTFAKQTALPGSPASPGGGPAVPVGAFFSGADAGVAVVSTGSGAAAYATTDRGTSWKPVSMPSPGATQQVTALDPQTLLIVGPAAVAVSKDGGATWKLHAIPGAGSPLTGIDCASATDCLLTTARGDLLLRTSDGLESVSKVTASTQAIYVAAYASSSRVVGAGAGGATVVSDDGGANFARVGGDIGGTYTRLRAFGPNSAVAIGARGALARTLDGGASWQALSVPTSLGLADVAFDSSKVGYALDLSGGLFKTANGGASWQTLDPGTSGAWAVGVPSSGVVLLVARTGLRRQTGGGRFVAISDRDVARAKLRDLDVNSGSTLAWGQRALALSTDRGASWRTLQRPNPSGGKRNALLIAGADFADSRHGFVLDTNGRVWRTSDGARHWERLDGVGSADGVSLSFGSASAGFLTVRRFGDDAAHGYVLRTTDSGRTWRPQLISRGVMVPGSIASGGPSRAVALVITPTPGIVPSRLFTTSSGGDTGRASTLTLATSRQTLTRRQLAKAHGTITLRGVLRGAVGGERIVVSFRDGRSVRWAHKVVTAGANGGSFTTTWRITGTSQFVAQWAGDSGRRGAGSQVLEVRVR